MSTRTYSSIFSAAAAGVNFKAANELTVEYIMTLFDAISSNKYHFTASSTSREYHADECLKVLNSNFSLNLPDVNWSSKEEVLGLLCVFIQRWDDIKSSTYTYRVLADIAFMYSV
jgi:hypothetical protein